MSNTPAARTAEIVLPVRPLEIVAPRRPRKDYTRGRLRPNLKPSPKLRSWPDVAAMLAGS